MTFTHSTCCHGTWITALSSQLPSTLPGMIGIPVAICLFGRHDRPTGLGCNARGLSPTIPIHPTSGKACGTGMIGRLSLEWVLLLRARAVASPTCTLLMPTLNGFWRNRPENLFLCGLFCPRPRDSNPALMGC